MNGRPSVVAVAYYAL